MKKILMIAVCASLLLTSCSSYTASGMMTGGTIGSLVGNIVGGRHSSSYGALIGMAAGAAVGAAVEKAETTKAERAAEARYNQHKQAYTRQYYERNGNGTRSGGDVNTQPEVVDPSKYVDPTNSGDDRIEIK
ncbi:MAG: hypothetical protein Q4F34_06160 [Prevotellaceae bacterium]|nr:hypothetical protein [Prevotellaceae bacterium]